MIKYWINGRKQRSWSVRAQDGNPCISRRWGDFVILMKYEDEL